jgi:hypothetical protein
MNTKAVDSGETMVLPQADLKLLQSVAARVQLDERCERIGRPRLFRVADA